MLWPMVILFLLGGLQGVLGWIMVKSGVGTSLVYVSHVRLAIHFMAGLILLAYVIWFALKISVPKDQVTYEPGLKNFTVLILVLLTLQLIYGAFMAGTHAAKAAITWPSINGQYFPPLVDEAGFWSSMINNLISIQFIHRNLAYLLAILIFIYTVKLYRQPQNGHLFKMRNWPFLLVMIQIGLGIFSLINYLNNLKLLFSILHQLFGILLLVSLVVTYYFLARKKG